ncbi:MAG: ATP-binding cassette domain-containing protein [Candidatus Manganitrophus sp.]|nr:MAG: ATP-binding cassette domain-containing protein [Candidatus Manganitrophus sp.]
MKFPTGLQVSYGQSEVIHQINFKAAKKNETVAIMGRNGMGKTTLFKALMGILPSKGGKIDVRRQRSHRPGKLSPGEQRHGLRAAGADDFPHPDRGGKYQNRPGEFQNQGDPGGHL